MVCNVNTNVNDVMICLLFKAGCCQYFSQFVDEIIVIVTIGGMAGPLKATTGLAGLAVAQYPHRMLTAVYHKILRTIKEMPEDYTYRKKTQVTQKSFSGLLLHNLTSFVLVNSFWATVCTRAQQLLRWVTVWPQ